jgi:hypothetical protein
VVRVVRARRRASRASRVCREYSLREIDPEISPFLDFLKNRNHSRESRAHRVAVAIAIAFVGCGRGRCCSRMQWRWWWHRLQPYNLLNSRSDESFIRNTSILGPRLEYVFMYSMRIPQYSTYISGRIPTFQRSFGIRIQVVGLQEEGEILAGWTRRRWNGGRGRGLASRAGIIGRAM